MSFKNGNIVRVLIKNFLTFDNVTVSPTPYLNLIIGPNGTGKSTILCAICICLGGKPDVTGRSKSIESFVKHGKEHATLEVEIYEEDGINPIIRREFGRNISRYYLQGKAKSKKEIESVIEKFSIQIDNLCTFLPQDKVANFARMNSVQLLEATEKAVGEPSLFEYHEVLRSSGSKMQSTKDKVIDLTNQVDALVKQNASMKDIVENVQEKARLEEEIESFRKQKKYHAYETVRKKYIEVMEQVQEISKILEKENSLIEPYKNEIDDSKNFLKAKNRILDQKIINFQKSNQRCSHLLSQVDDLSEDVKGAVFDFRSKKEAAELRQREVQDYRRQLDVLEKQLEGLPVVDEKEVQMRIQKLTQDINTMSNKLSRVATDQEEMLSERQSNLSRIKSHQTEIGLAKDVMQQRMELLRQRDSNAYKAAEWLKANERKFSAPFYMPICTLLNIKDPAYASIVENTISFNDLVAFVFEDKDDINRFKSMMDRLKIRVNIVHSAPVDLSIYKPPVPLDDLRKWGFDVYMSDLIDAPPAVLAYLHKNNAIHRIPITKKEHIAYDDLPDKVSLFFMGSLRVSRSRSRYDNELITESSKIREGTLLKITVNVERIRGLEREITICQENITACDKKMVELKNLENSMKGDLESWRNEKQVHASRKQARNQLQNRINMKRRQIQMKEAESFNEEEEEQKMQVKVSKLVKTMASFMKEGSQVTDKVVLPTQEYYNIKGVMKLRKVYMNNLTETIAQKQEEIQNLRVSLKKREDEKAKMKDEAKEVLESLCRSLKVKGHQNIPQGLILRYQKMTSEETDQKLSDLEARRDCIHTADPEEIRDYNEREATISNLQRELERLKSLKNDQHKRIEEGRARWVPCITELISNISSSFTAFMERMGCAGEVDLIHDVDEHDYSKYGIAIRVKFRGANKLRVLTAQHQSGGERAVATALYMLSLQNLTSVPFRCVDEINQGMDPVNERMILLMLMETAAKEESSQYFFVSPKLLPDLEYSDRVNTITVYNGFIAIPRDKFSIQDTIRRKRKLKAKHR